jgi:DNA-directed RNA polymerase specialized sigma24 family protein
VFEGYGEEAILWRVIERIPENYREPLVLFYREHQSVEDVAAALDLNTDPVIANGKS